MNPIYAALVYLVWFLSTYFVVVFLLFLIRYRKNLFVAPLQPPGEDLPTISMVISAFNEEEHIGKCISSVQNISYPKDKLEIVVVNDGSTDGTARAVSSFLKDKRIRFIDNKENKGKATCLNEGIRIAQGTFIACMDADSMVSRDILKKSIPFFQNPKVGAVTVTVKAKHRGSFLERVIEIEYILGLSLFLKLFSYLHCVYVTPGPFSIYRASLLKEIGGFDEKSITEDLEIAYRINKAGYTIASCMSTSVTTVIPHTFQGLYRQRRRWYSGALLTIWKHRTMFFTRKAGFFGIFIPFTYTLITLGLALFLVSIFMLASRLWRNISYFALTNFNFFEHFHWRELLDPLAISAFTILGVSGLLGTLAVLTSGLSATKAGFRKRKTSFVGYFLLFFLYQFFWLSSFASVLLRRKIKW